MVWLGRSTKNPLPLWAPIIVQFFFFLYVCLFVFGQQHRTDGNPEGMGGDTEMEMEGQLLNYFTACEASSKQVGKRGTNLDPHAFFALNDIRP